MFGCDAWGSNWTTCPSTEKPLSTDIKQNIICPSVLASVAATVQKNQLWQKTKYSHCMMSLWLLTSPLTSLQNFFAFPEGERGQRFLPFQNGKGGIFAIPEKRVLEGGRGQTRNPHQPVVDCFYFLPAPKPAPPLACNNQPVILFLPFRKGKVENATVDCFWYFIFLAPAPALQQQCNNQPGIFIFCNSPFPEGEGSNQFFITIPEGEMGQKN